MVPPTCLCSAQRPAAEHKPACSQHLHVEGRCAHRGVPAPQVCAVLRQVPEEITVFGDDIERAHKRSLLNGLVDTAPSVLGFAYAALSSAFQAAMQASNAGNQPAAEQQLAVLRAVLGAL